MDDDTEEKAMYIWEGLGAVSHEDGTTAGFKRSKPQGRVYKYVLAGDISPRSSGGAAHSPANQVLLDRHVFQLSRSLGAAVQETRQQLKRLFTQDAGEWKDFVGSRGPRLFVAQCAFGKP